MIRFIRRIKARRILKTKTLEEIVDQLLKIRHNQERQIEAERDFVNVISNFFAFEKRVRLEESRRKEEMDRNQKGTRADELY